MSEKTTKILNSLLDHTKRELTENGFTTSSRGEWERDSVWKYELIDMRALEHSIIINFYVYLRWDKPIKDREEQVLLSGQSLGNILGLNRSSFSVSFWAGSDAIVREIAGKLRQGLKWFDQFRTPASCRAEVAELLSLRETPALKECEQILNAIENTEK